MLNIAVGFDNAQLFEKTEFLAYHDPLTCLPNRRSLLETMERLIKRDTAFSVLIIDIDNFQSINDGLGYRIGDALLKKVAALFRHHFDSAVLLSRAAKMAEGDGQCVDRCCECVGSPAFWVALSYHGR
ncbi:GGDEF domain-containing protein [Halomonas sp. GFAJ-1]|uniref:GGDEF domain-containing protein n=1 Tax=Halomonas sp. GFAJ-1 TaxID=1118153 RepID=UPI0009E99E90|nr:GGDEF domain-containing protein [Halomonas sp. GFAJ-1]